MLLPPSRRRSALDYRIIAGYLAGTTSGAALTISAAWIVGGFTAPLPSSARVTLIGAGALAIWLIKRGSVSGVCLPEARRQIPAEVFGGGLVRGAYRFGFELGTGVRTYLPSPAPYVLVLTVLVGALNLESALLIALGFGLGRAAPLMLHMTVTTRERMTTAFLRGEITTAPLAASVVILMGALILV